MQKLKVRVQDAMDLHNQLHGTVDDAWWMLKPGQEHAISDTVDMNDKARVLSLYRTLRELGGKDYKNLLGADTALDKVRITKWHPSTCDCQVTYIWHRDHHEDVRVHHPHMSYKMCEHHDHLKRHHPEHHEELWGENQHMNRARGALAEHLGVDSPTVTFAFDAKRNLVLDHPELADPMKHGHAQLHLNNHPELKRVTKLASRG